MFSDLAINAAIWAAMIAVALTVVLLLYSIGLRAARIVHTQRTRRLHNIWWPIFAEVIASEGFSQIDEVPNARPGEKAEILREWNRFRSIVRGVSTSKLNLLARRLGLLEVARHQLKKGAVSSKLLAIQTLGNLQDRSKWSSIEEALDHPNIAISITAAAALVNIDPRRAIPQIVPLIGMRSKWPRTKVGHILKVAGPAVVSEPLCVAIENSPLEQALRLLQFTESAHIVDVNLMVDRLLKKRREPALLSAALKAARGHMRTNTIEALTRHQVWYVRMQAANLLGRAGRSEDCKILEPLLSDSQWWVRYRAAQAIVKLTSSGPNALRKLRERQRDRFASDILQQALAEKGLA